MALPQDDPARRLATEATVPGLVAAAIATDPTVANSAATMAQSTAGLVPVWKATTAYTAGQRVVAPDGDIVSAKIAFTSGASYAATNWNTSNHAVTLDNTVGQRAFAWDPDNARRQMIYGDTGWRKISTTEEIYIRRTGNIASIQIYGSIAGVSGDYDAITLPVGFRPRWHSDDQYTQGSALKRSYVLNTGTVRLYSHIAGSFTSFSDTWATDEAWPATLPGTATGNIPS